MPELPPIFDRSRRLRFAALILNGLLQAGAAVGVGLSLQRLFDGMTAPSASTFDGLTGPAIAIAMLSVLFGALKWRERVDAETLGQDYVVDTRMRIFKHLSALSVRAVEETRKGLILLRFVNDLTALRNWISLGLTRAAVSGVVVLTALIALTVMNPAIGGGLLLLAGVGVTGLLALGKRIDRTVREARRRRGNIAGNISEKLERMVLVQAFAQRKPERRKVKRQSVSLRNAMIGRASVTGLTRALVQVIAGLSLAVAGILGALAVREGSATPGEIVAAIGVVSLVTPSMFAFGRVYEYWKSAVVAKEKTLALLRRGPLVPPSTSAKPLGQISGELTFQNLSVAGAFEDFSACAKAGETVGIYGPNASGKSTLLNLALRLLDPDKGKVLLDGRDIRTIRTGELRRAVSIASSSMPLLRGTILSNIAYGSAKSTPEDVEEAARICDMDLASPGAPFYGERKVHEGGANLSAGERMRIILARALVARPRVLLLDEPEEHLDPDGVVALNRVISRFSGTILLVTHDQSLLRVADRVWHMEPEHSNERALSHAAAISNDAA